METKHSKINRAMGARIRAERGAKEMTVEDLALSSGIKPGALNHMTAADIRDINVTQIVWIAGALGIPVTELVNRAIADAGGMAAIMSEVPGTNVITGRFDPKRDYEDEHEAGGEIAAQGSDTESRGDEQTE